jgi:general secretion pathway protein D
MVTVDFKEVDVKTLLRFLAEKTRTNYFMDPAISAKITVIGPNPIPLSRAIIFLEAALESRGFTVVDSGDFKNVIPKAKASKAPIPLLFEPSRPLGSKLEQERTVTEFITLTYAPVDEIKTALASLLPDQGALLTHPQTNRLIVTATIRNLERVRRVIAALDVPIVGKTVRLLPVRYRKAEDLAKAITAILEKEELDKRLPPTKDQQVSKPALLFDPGHNTLIVVAIDRDQARVKALVEKLDEDPSAGPRVDFIELKFAEPAKVVEKINSIFKGTAEQGGASFVVVANEEPQSIMLRTSSPNLSKRIKEVIKHLDQARRTLDGSRVRVYHMEFAEAEKVAEILGQISFLSIAEQTGVAPKNSGAGKENKDEVKIVADTNTNSLVITAPRDMYPAIEAVISELDKVKPQVLVEVLIAEVDYDWARGVGMDFNFLNQTSTSTNRPFALGNADNLEGLFSGGGIANGLSVGMLSDKAFDLTAAAGGDAGELSKISILARLFQNSSHANILSAPVLMTSDNETAKIQVGERIQLPASFSTAANTGLNSVTSFTSEDLGVILEITPRITRNDHVILKVDQNISSRTGDLIGSLQLPVISNREVSTNINVMNEETVVIGGLISEEENHKSTGIPGLSRLPLLGKLFRNRQTTKRKTNLLIFLTPHIIRGEGEARYYAEKASEELRVGIKRSRASEDSVLRRVFQPENEMSRFGRRTPSAPGQKQLPAPGPVRLSARLQRVVEGLRARYRQGGRGTGDGDVVEIPRGTGG